MITPGIIFTMLGFYVLEYQLVICVCMCVINWPQEFQWNPSTATVGNHNNVIKCRMGWSGKGEINLVSVL